MSTLQRGLPTSSPPRRSAAAELVKSAGQADRDLKAGSREHAGKGRRATQRIALDLPSDVVDELKDAVVYLQRNGYPEVTQVGVVADAVRVALGEVRKHHGLERFPARGEHKPKPGRRAV